MTEESLRTLLTTEGLGRIADQLMERTAPTVRVYIQHAHEEDIPIGASKLGGKPDLPDGIEWPSWHEPMAFIAQFNLAEVAPFDRESALPAHGLLSFFYETDGEPLYAVRWGMPDDAPYLEDYGVDVARGWRVLYHEGEPDLFVRQERPSGLNDWVRYAPCAARFALAATLPDVDGPELHSIGLTDAERYTLIGLYDQINWGERWEDGGHHLLGFPYNLGGPALVESDEQAHRTPSGWVHATPTERLRIERDTTARWRLRLQVSGSDATQMGWAGGVLHWCIEEERLRRRDFSQVWLNMQFL